MNTGSRSHDADRQPDLPGGFPSGLLPGLGAGPAVLAALGDRLAARAESEGLLDASYRTVDSPFGPLLLAATERGLVRVAFAAEGHEAVLGDLAARLGPRILAGGTRLDTAARQLEEYFAGRRRGFELPLDRALSSGYRREVHEYLPHIGYGSTASYAEIARATGRPRAVRAVGTACATNPLPLVVPCHRVLRSDGTLGGYLGGPEAKAALLELERAAA
ncbi:methylated-DNA--[protein]-cysteine S-methyltransferase [Zafaria sp. Z1313]|uniref:methylated-DNA--[protein]-cysteine S-methyltransferase n=1 Tax=Zafaria sp. Z1313 TaxID=3423202 RepID=UPI003D3025D3